jgi:hypothetical protein
MQRTHTLTFYPRERPAAEDAFGGVAVNFGLAVATDVPANVQMRGGAVRQDDAGRRFDAAARAFVERGVLEIAHDMGVQVTSGPIPAPGRFIVLNVRDQGPGWDVEIDLDLTEEEFAAT